MRVRVTWCQHVSQLEVGEGVAVATAAGFVRKNRKRFDLSGS